MIDSGLFHILWQQVRAAFHSLHRNETDEEMAMVIAPDWIVISRDGIHRLLQLTLELFLQVMNTFNWSFFESNNRFGFSECINV